jgi:hypothetical protein
MTCRTELAYVGSGFSRIFNEPDFQRRVELSATELLIG